MESNKDLPSSVPSSLSTPSTSAAADVSACRTCPHCTRRMRSLKFDKHSLCVACRDVKCSVEFRCSECRSWSKDFMIGYVKHQRSLVSKGNRKVTTSPSVPATTAPVVSLPSLPVVSEDQLRSYVHSVLANLLSQSGSVGPNLLSTAPPAVPNSAPMSIGAAGGLSSDTPFEVPITDSPGVVLPTNQEDLLPPPNVSVCVPNLVMSGVSSMGGSLSSGHGHSFSAARGMDQLRVVGVAPSANVTVDSALSPGSLLFPFSDSGFASLSSASSSRSLSLPDSGPSSSSFHSAPPLSSYPLPSPFFILLPSLLPGIPLPLSLLALLFLPCLLPSWFPSHCFLFFFCSSFFLFSCCSFSFGVPSSSFSRFSFFGCLCFCSSCLFLVLFCFFFLFLSRLCCVSGFGVRVV